MAGHTKGFHTRTPQKFTCCVEIPTVNSPKSRSPHSSQNTMLLATPPITLKGSMNSLLTPKSPSKLAMLNNNGSPKSNGNSNPMYHSPGNNHSRSVSNQRKLRTAADILHATTPVDLEAQRHNEELKKKCAFEVQNSDGCFALVESTHFNPAIPCIPLHLSSQTRSV